MQLCLEARSSRFLGVPGGEEAQESWVDVRMRVRSASSGASSRKGALCVI